MRMIRGTDNYSIDILAHFFEHFAEVIIFLSFGELFTLLAKGIIIDIAEANNFAKGAPGEPTPAEVADGVVAELGLTEAAHTVIGNWHMRGVSGGQRRRVVIGCELVVSPSLIFLDEPTSGATCCVALHRQRCG